MAAPHDIVSPETRRETFLDDDVDVFIAMAMVNPKGRDEGKEWVTLLNMSSDDVDISGWTLRDNSNSSFDINSVLNNADRIIASGMAVID